MRAIKVQAASCRTQAGAEAQLQTIARARFDTILYNIYFEGAHYQSSYWPRCTAIEAGFDPLGYLCRRGAELGLSVYAWVCPGVYVYQFDPAWDTGGHWLNFAVPAARQRVVDIAAEITSRYPCGISLDYMRSSGGVVPFTTADITETVRMVRQAVGTRPVDAHVFYGDWLRVLQDWPAWLRAGLINTVSPMLNPYTVRPPMIHYIQSWLRTYIEPLGFPQERIIPCLYLAEWYNAGSETTKTVDQMRLEIEDARGEGFNGIAIWDSRPEHLTQAMIDFLVKELDMPIVTDLKTSADALDAKAVTLVQDAADLNAQAAKLRELATQLETADKLADELADAL